MIRPGSSRGGSAWSLFYVAASEASAGASKGHLLVLEGQRANHSLKNAPAANSSLSSVWRQMAPCASNHIQACFLDMILFFPAEQVACGVPGPGVKSEPHLRPAAQPRARPDPEPRERGPIFTETHPQPAEPQLGTPRHGSWPAVILRLSGALGGVATPLLQSLPSAVY